MMTSRLLVLLLITICCFQSLNAQEVKSVTFEELSNEMESSEAKVQVINFWASWCKPCIKEMPYFEAAQKKFANRGVEVLLVSLDFSHSKAASFKKDKNIKCPMVYLNETDHNKWINKVDSNWSGAIPATLFHTPHNGRKVLYEKEFNEGELEQEINKFLNQ